MYGKVVALDDVSFDIHVNEIMGLIGPNGAGKSTLIGIVSGALSATRGNITFNGQSILGLPAYRIGGLGIARTFQLVQPFWHLTVRECIMLGVLFGSDEHRLRSPTAANKRAMDLIDIFGLQSKADVPTELLTTSERRKLEVARTIAARPKLLLLDEVMAGLSGVEITQMISLLHRLRENGVSVVIIEHVMQAVRGLSDRVVVLHHGKKIADGALSDVLAQEGVARHYVGAIR